MPCLTLLSGEPRLRENNGVHGPSQKPAHTKELMHGSQRVWGAHEGWLKDLSLKDTR